MPARLAIDIGGTFTDVVLERDGLARSIKVLTTPMNPAEGFMRGARDLLAQTNTSPGDIELIIHGTTLATNALIERKGARTALIVTEGHRDSLEIAYESRFDQYDIFADRLPPLVPRELRLPVRERVDFRGGVLTPLDEGSLDAAIEILERERIESVAIGLLHAYANPAHERRIAEVVATRLPNVALSLGSEVCPEIREYERQSTTVANAYIMPLMAGYLRKLEADLKSEGFACPFLLMTSGGCLVTVETAANFPIRLVESGPAGGAILAAHIARELGDDRVLSFDMGGTTAKICLIDKGEPLLSRLLEVDRAHRFMKGSGMPVKIPVVEMVEIGAGGGSIATVDALSRIRVGPESAGAEPGPACYGRGGEGATVTDANLVLGRLASAGFAGGKMQLDRSAAETALARSVGEPLALDAAQAAEGVIEIVDENMAGAARVHAVERGLDIANRTMIAFGGAAPSHAARLATKLGIERIIIPKGAGVGSAIGFLIAPVAYEVVRSRYVRLDSFEPEGLEALFRAMREEAEAVVRLAEPEKELVEQRHAYARYVGQGHEIKVEVPTTALAAADGARIRAAFEAEYRRQYDRNVPDLAVEVLTWSSVVSAPRAKSPVASDAAGGAGVAARAAGMRQVRFPGADASLAAGEFPRQELAPDLHVAGPAVITEDQTTTAIPPGFQARVNRRGDIVLERKEKRPAPGGGAAERIRNQILWDRLIAAVEEQAQALIRTAFSTTVREAGDLSAGVFDLRGRMLAQAVTGTPGHVNAMAASVGYFIERFPLASMADGDVYVTNDSWLGTGHQFDFTVVTPIFRKGAIVALIAATIHVVDVGGRGYGPDAGQVFEEGICIPIMPLFRRGEINQDLIAILRANVREPVQLVGDLYSLTTSNAVGGKRLVELMDEFGLADLGAIADHVVETSRAAMLSEIAAWPGGVYENEMACDGYDRPILLKARLTIGKDGIDIDFAGTSRTSAFGVNVPLTYTQAYGSFGVRSMIGGKIPNNAGSLAPIRVAAPLGCILNAERPAAVAARHVIGHLLPDVVLGCLEKAMPGRVPAEGASSLWSSMLVGGHGHTGAAAEGEATPFSVTVFHSGGTGGRPGKPGLSATAFPSGVRSTPVEVTESVAPLIFTRKELRSGSGGAGRHRGGDGQVIEITHADGAAFAAFCLFERIDHAARGRNGGDSGQPGRVGLASGGKLRGKGKQVIPAGDRLVMESPGGGGLGRLERHLK
jgi:N-methylhydantoinase A/oxoprolinase/acetone carboxylase beta subunit/N-methylhydantoinase B/oxoprolinase/acetone carboxylase alpha subunit